MSRRAVRSTVAHPLDVFSQVQLGFAPAASVTRTFLTQHFRDELYRIHMTDVKLSALDHRSITQLLRQLLFNRYLSVPCRAYAFDLEFTSLPRFTADGPQAEIIEMGLYCPVRDAELSILIRPTHCNVTAEVEALTGLTNADVAKGLSFREAWAVAEQFMFASGPLLSEESKEGVLLLSHGGKTADVSMLDWAFRGLGDVQLPPSVRFGDTYHMVLDLHRRRPVTVDKHPPSWKLADLHKWMKLPPPQPRVVERYPQARGSKGTKSAKAHRAGHDATLTWKVLEATLERYGDESLSPTQQLVQRFFGDKTSEALRRTISEEPISPADPTTLDLD